MTGFPVTGDAGEDCGSPYIQPASALTAATPMPGGAEPLAFPPSVRNGSWTLTPFGLAVMDSGVVLPCAAFRRVAGWTPPARGWSSIGHHQPGLSCRTSPRYGDGPDPVTAAQASVVVSGM